jgi:hypothetical protein
MLVGLQQVSSQDTSRGSDTSRLHNLGQKQQEDLVATSYGMERSHQEWRKNKLDAPRIRICYNSQP